MTSDENTLQPAAWKARIAGLFYLLTFLTGGLAVYAGRGIVVRGDAAATAVHIVAHAGSWRLYFAADLLVMVWYVAVTALFYELFERVNRSLSLLAAFFSLVGCAVQAFATLFDLAPLTILGSSPYLRAFRPEQRQALALLSLELHVPAYNIGLVFFGVYCLLIGYLVFRSTFLPRILGVLMMLGGVSWLTFLWPPLAAALHPYNLLPGIVGEGSLTVWLIARGVSIPRSQGATATASSGSTRPGS